MVIGTSRGGLQALSVLLGGLPAGFALPLAIVQHRGVHGDGLLASALRTSCTLPVHEVEDKDPIEAGHVYLAPADYHLLVDGDRFALSTDGPVCHARPSIDVLFESAAAAFSEAVLAVILTGTGEGGARGVAEVKRRGGTLVVEDPRTAEHGALPVATLAEVPADAVLPLDQIAPFLVRSDA